MHQLRVHKRWIFFRPVLKYTRIIDLYITMLEVGTTCAAH